MKKILLLLPILLLTNFIKKDKEAYVLFDSKGKKTDYSQLLIEAKKADIILFGELHDNPICHWLQKTLTEDLFIEKKKN